MDNLLSTAVNFLVFATAYGGFLFAGTKLARIEESKYGFCALLALGATLVMLVAWLLLGSFDVAGQVVTILLGLGTLFYLLLRTFNCGPGKAALSIVISIAIPAVISLLARLFTASPPA